MSSRPSAFVFTQPGPLRLYSTTELLAMPPPTWLIEPIMPAGGLIALIGQPGTCKTFIAIDMAMSVASGGFWQGRPVKPGFVLYVSAEGGKGIGKRALAWLTARGVEAKQTRVAWLIESVPVTGDSTGVQTLLDRINNEVTEQPTLVVIDTLARCFDGDENQQEDMNRFVAGVDRLRHELQATVIVVHHTRLDGDRERGNTAFRGAADTMMFLDRKPDRIVLKCSKQKDAEEFEPITLKLKTVAGTDSCVIEQSRQMQKEQKTADILDILLEKGSLTWDEWSSIAVSRGMTKITFNRNLRILKESGQIVNKNKLYEVV